MLHIVHLEEIEALLLDSLALVEHQDQRSPEFSPRVRDWLTRLETVLMANRLYQAGSVAAIRSSLIAAEHGHVPGELKFRGRPTRSRVLSVVASQCMQQAVSLANALVAEHRARISEAERITRQIVTTAAARGLLSYDAAEQGTTQYLRSVRQILATSSDLETAASHVEGLVGPHDLLVLLDRALTAQLNPPTWRK